MIKNLFVLLVYITSLSISYSQNSLSPRIGSEIDVYEKKYFGLFPKIKNFKSATTTLKADSSYECLVTYSLDKTSKDTIIKIGPKTAKNLSIFIEGFELCQNKERVPNWNAFDGIANYTKIIDLEVKIGTNLIIVDLKGNMTQGQLVYTNDSVVVLVPNSGLYNWTYAQYAHKIKISNITSIKIDKKGGFWQGAKSGALIVGGTFAVITGIFAFSIWDFSDAFLLVAVEAIGGGILGGLVGGVIGAASGTTSQETINAYEKEQRDFINYLKENSAFTYYCPPELEKIVVQ